MLFLLFVATFPKRPFPPGGASREFKAGKNQNQLSEENIKKIVKTYRDGDNVEKYAYLASLKEIQENHTLKREEAQYAENEQKEEA